MTDDLIDRILLDDALEPSAGFAEGVMHAIRGAAAEPPPLRFPWLRFAAGLLACLVLAAAGALLLTPYLAPALALSTRALEEIAPLWPELMYALLASLAGLAAARLPRLLARS